MTPRNRALRASRRRAGRGFTLVELMVALIAGVIISISVVGLAKSATDTFHEEVRSQTVEETLRTATNRLRNDLVRAAYNSTGNVKWDPRSCALAVGGAGCSMATPSVNGTPNSPLYTDDIQNLQGIHIDVGGSKLATEGAYTLATKHGLNPDKITIGGDFTSDDTYPFMVGSGQACGSMRLLLNLGQDDQALARIFTSASPAATMTNLFMAAGANSFARIEDGNGRYQYVEVCGTGLVSTTQAYIDVTNATNNPGCTGNNVPANLAVAPGQTAGTCGVGGTATLNGLIAPIQRVQWFLGPNPNPADTRLDPPAGVDIPANKFNLYRQYIDNTSPPAAGPPTNGVGAPELVAEYAVDLKFGVTLQNPVTNALVVADMDSTPDDSTGPVATATQWASATPQAKTGVGAPGPQNVRSVRFRVSVRTPIPDRTANLTFAAGTPYILRYCIQNAALAACTQFTRVRTLVSEVALVNQGAASGAAGGQTY